MSFSAKAQAILERGFAAFRNTHVRPESGHTQINRGTIQDDNHTLQFACAVGVIAFEAATLQGLSDALREAESDRNAKTWVARIFGVSIHEVIQIEKGFDQFFDTGKAKEREDYETAYLDDDPEMYQAGWHIAKRATKHYQELDEAEDEAWKVYAEKGLKDYVPFPLWSRAEWEKLDPLTRLWRKAMDEECAGEDCPEKMVVLIG